MKFLSLIASSMLIGAALASPMLAGQAIAAPEIDASSATAALTLLSGGLLLIAGPAQEVASALFAGDGLRCISTLVPHLST